MTRPIQNNARKFGSAAALVLGAALLVGAASSAQAKDEFEKGFKSELGRIAAHEAVFIGRGVLGQVVHGGIVRVDNRGGGRDHRGGGRHDGDHGNSHYKQNWNYQPHYAPTRHHVKHRRGYGHRRHFFKHRHRHNWHNRHCHH